MLLSVSARVGNAGKEDLAGLIRDNHLQLKKITNYPIDINMPDPEFKLKF